MNNIEKEKVKGRKKERKEGRKVKGRNELNVN
jgi:hypothetical protein